MPLPKLHLPAISMTFAVACLSLPTMTHAAESGVCVTNSFDEPLLFVAQSRGADQVSKWLDPGQTLCSNADTGKGGVVRVFADEDAEEGCSRLAPTDATEILLDFVEFDRCRWAAHGD